MPTDASFRFSTYLTFALTCAALGYAEVDVLPEVAVFALLAIIGLGVLYFLESRVALLSIPDANRLGVCIVLGYALWVGYRVKHEFDTNELANMGWHLLIVAMCGPLVMVLLVAKGARRGKHAGDYWTLHGIALAGLGLAAAFAESPICFGLVGAYLIAAVWSLSLLYLGRARGAIPPVPGGKQPATKALTVAADPTGHRSDLRPAVVWAVVATALAVPLYLLTPRSSAARADFGKPRVEIGFAADQMVDLNRTGPLKVNTETAFEVTARQKDGSPKTDLNPTQLWRGRTLRNYANGEWKHSDETLPEIAPLASHPTVWTPPELGPDQFTLSFEVPARLRAAFVADPVIWAGGQPSPLAAVHEDAEHGWLPIGDGSFFWDPSKRPPRSSPRKYTQIYRSVPDPDVGPAFRFVDRQFDSRLASTRANPVVRVKDYADGVIRELIRTGELPADCRDTVTLLPRYEYQDLVARRFAAYLATTPTLTYTTDLKRSNTHVDPIEDFLFHSKSGHCERFATALVLMLRSQNIPAVFVLGFKGHETDGDGHYLVRQEHAHAWVSALVAKPDTAADVDPLTRLYYWRCLDPTPGAAQNDAPGERAWWDNANTWVESQFQEYVTNYTPEQRQKSLTEVGSHLVRVETLLGAAALVGVLFAARSVRRRMAARRETPTPVESESGRWFGELVALLTAHGIMRAPGDTPLEFAARATTALRHWTRCAPLADVPMAWAEAYYQHRYGGVPPSDARLAELEAGLRALREALRTTSTPPVEDQA
jgi:protein-glutamine gamma-glutamyltransferase